MDLLLARHGERRYIQRYGYGMNPERIHIIEGDITTLDVDAIVNAANSSLTGGGGVDGAIHRAAGPDLLRECLTIGHCPTGQARITKGYRLKAKHVIHTVGPVYRGGSRGEAELLASCYRSSLELAQLHNLTSIAFPAISTGIYGYPKDEACGIALRTVLSFIKESGYKPDVYFVLFDSGNAERYRGAIGSIWHELF